VYLDDLRKRLMDLAKHRISSGLLTERGLAKKCGLSQPHMHNVLKGVRSVSVEAADQILIALDCDVTDLILRFPFEGDLGTKAVPVLRTRIGPGISPNFRVFCGFLPVPLAVVQGIVNPVIGRLAPDPSLPAGFKALDTVLLDQNPEVLLRPVSGSPYVLKNGESSHVRYPALQGGRVYLCQTPEPSTLEGVPYVSIHGGARGKDILDLIRGRIVWISREIHEKSFRQADSFGEND